MCVVEPLEPQRVREIGSRRFFGARPYPFDMALVEQRDGAPLCDLIRERLGDVDCVVDAGCGYGRYTEVLQERVRSVLAVDHSQACVSRTVARVPRVLGLCADVSALPLSNSSVDGVLSAYSSLGLDGSDFRSELSELGRVTRPGGRLLLDTAGPGARRMSIGVERVPTGVGIHLRWSRGSERCQANCAMSLQRCGLWLLRSRVFTAAEVHDALAPDWVVTGLLGSYDGLAYDADSPRLIVVAVRS